jgi:tRNA U38,U39,U40 pseudouridine synthase TruA
VGHVKIQRILSMKNKRYIWGTDWFEPEGEESCAAWQEIIKLKSKYIFQWPRACFLSEEQINRVRNEALRKQIQIPLLAEEKKYYESCIESIQKHYRLYLIHRGNKELHADESRSEKSSETKLEKNKDIRKKYLQLWKNNPDISTRKLNDMFFEKYPKVNITSKTLRKWREENEHK